MKNPSKKASSKKTPPKKTPPKKKIRITIADLTISYGYPFKRLIDDGRDLPDLDREVSRAWKDATPHECEMLLGWQCVALHYPGGWPALIEQLESPEELEEPEEPEE